MNKLVTGLAVLCLPMLCLAATVPQRVSTDTAVVSGLVLADEAGGNPLGGAIVTVTGGNLSRPRSAVTDVNGAFSIDHLPPGRLTVSASKAAYLAMTYGAKRPNQPGTALNISVGQHMSGIALRLPRGAVITGTLRDRNGAALPGLPVSAIPLTIGGTPAATAAIVSATTDDRGVYRIFSLLPGNYIVAATFDAGATGAITIPSTDEIDRRLAELQHAAPTPGPRAAGTSQTPAPKPPSYSLGPTFFPGAATATDAEQLTLASGDERTADFTVGPVRAGSVDGVVQTADGSRLPTMTVALEQDAPTLPYLLVSHPALTVRPTVTDGHFVFTSVTPGKYILSARSETAPPAGSFVLRGAQAPTPAATLLFGMIDITVTGDDLSGLTLTLQPGMHFVGKAAFDGATPPTPTYLAALRVALTPTRAGLTNRSQNLRSGTPPPAPIRPGDTFDVGDIFAGSYIVSVTGFSTGPVPGTWWPRSAMINGKDALDVPIEFKDGIDLAGAILTFSDRPAELSGLLGTAANAPATDYFVVVFTTDQSLWRTGARRVKSTRPASDGRFAVSDLPGGEYWIAALTDVEPDDLADPAFLAQLVPGAVKVTLADGEKRTQDLKIR